MQPSDTAQRQGALTSLWQRRLVGMGVIGFLLFFWIHTGHEFVLLDDDVHTFGNPHFQKLSVDSIKSLWTEPFFGMYIPVTYTVWGMEVPISQFFGSVGAPLGLSASVFHFGNVLLHLFNTILLFGFLVALFRRHNVSQLAILAGCFYFAFHPVQVEAVAWVSARRDLLATFFALLTCHLSLAALGDERVRDRRLKWGYACLTFIAAMLSKPSLVALPGALAVAYLGFGVTRWTSVRWWLLACGLFTLPVVLITKLQQPPSLLDFHVPYWFRPVVTLDALSFYLGKIVFPYPLAIDYGRSPKWLMQHGAWQLTALFPLAIAGIAWRKKIGRLYWVAIAATLVALSPVSGFLSFAYQQFSTVTDHYVYFPNVFFAAFVALMAQFCINKISMERAPAVFGAICSVWLVASVLYSGYWVNSETLFVHSVKHYRDGQAASNNLGWVREQQERLAEAEALYKHAYSLRPSWMDAKYNVANILAKQGQYAASIPLLYEILREKPRHADANHVLGLVHLHAEKYQDALHYLANAVAYDPSRPNYHAKLGTAYANLNDFDQAVKYFREAIRLSPGLAEAHNNLGVILQRQGKIEEAIESYQNSFRVKPQYLQGVANLTRLLVTSNRCDQALTYFDELERASGKLGEFRQDKAYCLDRLGRKSEAKLEWERFQAEFPRAKVAGGAQQQKSRLPASQKKP